MNISDDNKQYLLSNQSAHYAYRSQAWRYGVMLVVLSGVMLGALVPFGLDFTDAGYSVAIAWTHAMIPQAADWNLNTFGTPTIVGLWVSLMERCGWHSLIGLRIAWLLAMLATVVSVYWLLVVVYARTRGLHPRLLAAVLIPTLILAVFNSEEVIVPDYHNFPPVLCVVSAALFLRTFFPMSSALYWRLLTAGSGFIASLAVFARLPMLAFLLAMLCMAAMFQAQHPSLPTRWQRLVWLLGGITLGALASWLLLHYSGFDLRWVIAETADSYRANTEFMRTVDPALGYMPLWKSTLLRYAKIVGMGVLLLFVCWLWQRFTYAFSSTQQHRSSQLSALKWLTLLLWSAVVVILVLRGASGVMGFHYGPITSVLLGAPLLGIALILVADWRSLDTPQRVLMLAALLVFVVASLGGSGVWVSTFRHGVWLMLPVVLVESLAPRPARLALSRASQLVDTRFLALLLITGTISLGITLRVQMPYRDKPIYMLHSTVRHPALQGIRTSSSRAQYLTEVLDAAQKLGIKSNDTIQCYPDGALLYFLTETVPWYQDTWIGMQWTSRDDLRHRAVAAATSLPRYIIRLKFDPNSPPSLDDEQPFCSYQLGSDSLYYGFLNQPASRYLDSLWAQHRYTIGFENKGFIILQRP